MFSRRLQGGENCELKPWSDRLLVEPSPKILPIRSEDVYVNHPSVHESEIFLVRGLLRAQGHRPLGGFEAAQAARDHVLSRFEAFEDVPTSFDLSGANLTRGIGERDSAVVIADHHSA